MCFVLSVFPALVDKITAALSNDGASCSRSGTLTTPEFVNVIDDGAKQKSSGLSSIISAPSSPCSVRASLQLENFMAEVSCTFFHYYFFGWLADINFNYFSLLGQKSVSLLASNAVVNATWKAYRHCRLV